MNIAELKDKLRAKRDEIILLLIVGVIVLSIVIGVKMQKDYGSRKRAEEEALRPPEKVTLTPSQQQPGNGGQRARSSSGGGAYFLKPSAEELLSVIRDSGQAQLPKDNQKYMGFRVMWPCYFFQVQKQEGDRATVMLDVSEDGFGATILTDIDLKLFPEILDIKRGEKVWIAGEIIGIDPTGTGTIHIVTEEVRFQEGLLDAIRGEPADQTAAPQ